MISIETDTINATKVGDLEIKGSGKSGRKWERVGVGGKQQRVEKAIGLWGEKV